MGEAERSRRAAEEPFVGREPQLRALEGALDRALEGSGSVVVVQGEAGIGKTALLAALCRRARARHPELSLARGRCVEQYGAGEPYLPFLDGLAKLAVSRAGEQVRGLLQAYAPTWCLQVPAAMAGLDSPETLRMQAAGASPERMMREFGNVFEISARTNPLLGVLEDLQWADASTLDLVRHLASRVERQRILIAVSVRESDATPPLVTSSLQKLEAVASVQWIPLRSLEPADVRALLDASFVPNDFPEDLAETCYDRAEGHPLFLKKILGLLEEEGRVARRDGRWALAGPLPAGELPVPVSVRGLIEQRIASLDEEDARILSCASVIGREFTSPVLATLLGIDELAVEEHLDRIAGAHHLVKILGEQELSDGSLAMRYEFAHSFYQEILYEKLVTRKRAQLHGSVARELERRRVGESPAGAAQLAHHFERAREFEAACRYVLEAGATALRRSAFQEALAYAARAEAMLDRVPDGERSRLRFDLSRLRGDVMVASGDFDRASDEYEELRVESRRLDDARAEAVALLGSCRSLFFGRRTDELAVCAYEALGAASRSGDAALCAEARAAVALVGIEAGGDFGEIKPLLDDLISEAERIGCEPALLSALTYRGFVDYWESRFGKASERLERARLLAAQRGDGFALLMCQMLAGLARINCGEVSQALATLGAARELAVSNGDTFWQPRLASALAFVHRELESFDAALELDAEALGLAREASLSEAASDALVNMAVSHTRAGDLKAAAAVLKEVADASRDQPWLAWQHRLRARAAAAEHAVAAGDVETAERETSDLVEEAERHGAVSYAVIGHTLAARLAHAGGSDASCESHVREARKLLADRDVPLVGWRALAALAELAWDRGDFDTGRNLYHGASLLLHRIADGIDEPALRESFLGTSAVKVVLERAGAA